jgi:hypothetical protein
MNEYDYGNCDYAYGYAPPAPGMVENYETYYPKEVSEYELPLLTNEEWMT